MICAHCSSEKVRIFNSEVAIRELADQEKTDRAGIPKISDLFTVRIHRVHSSTKRTRCTRKTHPIALEQVAFPPLNEAVDYRAASLCGPLELGIASPIWFFSVRRLHCG